VLAVNEFRNYARIVRSAAAVSLLALVVTNSATASTIRFPTPATSAQISRLVAASISIEKLPRTMVPPLAQIPNDTATNSPLHAPTVCKVASRACTFGDRSSRKLVVLFGDSHAWMWINGVNPAVRAAGFRLELFAYPGCPVARVTIWAAPLNKIFRACDTWRATTIAHIKNQHPSLVLLSERTSDLFVNATTLVTSRQITSGLTATIAQLQSSTTRVSVIGDLPTYTNLQSPDTCMAVYPTNIQKCSTRVHNPVTAWASHAQAEKLAAQHTKSTFIDPTAWFCTKGSCSPIVGDMATYLNGSHINATYAAFLSGVLGARITPLL
jgi:hypothetical protein